MIKPANVARVPVVWSLPVYSKEDRLLSKSWSWVYRLIRSGVLCSSRMTGADRYGDASGNTVCMSCLVTWKLQWRHTEL